MLSLPLFSCALARCVYLCAIFCTSENARINRHCIMLFSITWHRSNIIFKRRNVLWQMVLRYAWLQRAPSPTLGDPNYRTGIHRTDIGTSRWECAEVLRMLSMVYTLSDWCVLCTYAHYKCTEEARKTGTARRRSEERKKLNKKLKHTPSKTCRWNEKDWQRGS